MGLRFVSHGGVLGEDSRLKEIQIMLTDFEIEPKEIRVPVYEPVRLLVSNFGSTEHLFAVGGNNNECGFGVHCLKPGQTKALEHVFTEPGSFKTECQKTADNSLALSGWLVVEA